VSQLAMNFAFVHMSAVLGTKVFQVQSALRIIVLCYKLRRNCKYAAERIFLIIARVSSR
jgi:hypothetical protein